MDIFSIADPQQLLLVRISLIWAFVLVGLVLALQVSQTQTDTPLKWTRLTDESR
jgi:hypothetical protein